MKVSKNDYKKLKLDELEKCPFCNSDASLWFFGDGDKQSSVFFVICDKCGAKTFGNIVSYKIAVRRWNKRV